MRHVDCSPIDVSFLGEVVDLGHVLAAVYAELAELDFMRTWFLDLDE